MKFIAFAVLYICLVQSTRINEIKDIVKWEFKAVRKGMDATLYFKATVEKNWHIYSTVTPEGGPVPTEFKFTPNSSVKFIGKIIEPSPVSKHDPNFDLQVKYFNNEVLFSQKIKLTNKASTQISGTVTYMVCDDAKCLPPTDVNFKIDVPAMQ